MAVVEFSRPDEAAKGFRAVAYRRLGNSIIYLEKGPLGMFDEHFIPTGKDDSIKPQTISNAIRVPEQSIGDISKSIDSDQDLSIQNGTALYLKNLAFSTTQDRLVKLFSHPPSPLLVYRLNPIQNSLADVWVWDMVLLVLKTRKGLKWL